jgi:ABC-type transport system involved in multi-copper enzyme maturation permease subunit
MLLRIARFELRYLLRNPLVWVTAAATFVFLFAAISTGLELGSEGGLLQNAALATLRNALMASLTYVFVTTAFVAGAVTRDDDTGFGPIIRSTRITKFEYLTGRFLGAFAVAALCLLLVPLASWLATLMPWVAPGTVGPNRLVDHLYAWLLIALPNVFIHAALFFALATITRSMMATYLGVVAFVSGYFALQGAFADRPQLQTVMQLADPFAMRAVQDAVRYWSVAERNVMLPPFTGALLYNRLLWIGIAVLCLTLAHAAYRFADQGMSRRQRRKHRLAERDAVMADLAPATSSASLPAPRHDGAARRALLWMRTRFEVRQVAFHPAFIVLMAWGMYITGLVLLTQRDPDGRPSYPTTLSMIPEIDEAISMVLLVVAIYYAGELVWRERDRRMDVIVDATPMPNWAYVVPKMLAMVVVLVGILLVTVVASVLVQLSLDFTDLEIGKYLLWYVLPRTWDMLLLAALAIFVQAISPHKVVGWGIMVAFFFWQQLNTTVDHNLLLFGGTPYVPLSDINGAGSFWHAAWMFRVYWGAFAVMLLLAAHLLWRRGADIRLGARFNAARRRLTGGPARVAAAALLIFCASGATAFYNTNVLNVYRTKSASEARLAAYEKKYGQYAGLPQPRITAIALDVALFPAERRAETHGRLRIRNLTTHAIPDIHLRLIGDDLELTGLTLPDAQLISNDTDYRYRIYHLDTPMQPGEERVMQFSTRLWLRGFRNEPTNTRIVENGTFLNESHLMPFIGMADAGTLKDPATRRRYGLPPARGTPKLGDLSATETPTYGRGWATSDITVSTPADQVPIAPGNRVSDVRRDGRHIVRFVSTVPIHPRFSIQSARYAEKHRQHGDVNLAVYYHPAHAWNVDRMLDALAAALDYYTANFGPYPFDHARIVEFPGYHDFAQAFAGTIPYSEDVGFASDYHAPETIDYVTYLTAHELAHQYWSHQVVGADMEGRELLSETLAQYSAQMVLKKMRGADHLRRYLQFELDRYLEGRANNGGVEEPTLTRVDGQDYVTYRKGALAMYLLQERLGEEGVNRALRALLEKYRFKGAPFPRSLDLVAALRAQATTQEEQTLITDLFERLTIYDLKATAPTAVRRADGRWDVAVPVEAKKLYYDAQGRETEATLDERIEVGLFTAEPGRDAFDAKNVIVMERRPIRSGAQVLTFITDRRPTFGGVDPYNYYIDRNSRDNVQPVR